jgi:hypothetical protein
MMGKNSIQTSSIVWDDGGSNSCWEILRATLDIISSDCEWAAGFIRTCSKEILL